jgi:hypothetical protein
MAIPNAEKIIQRAQNGERIQRKERLHAIAYMMSVMSSLTNREIGEIFQIDERMVRNDKRKVKEEKAASIKEDDIGLVIADIAMTYENEIRDIQKSKEKCKSGTKDYLAHCKAIFDMQRQKVEALQNLGYYPKNLGNMVIEKFDFQAIVSKDGSVNSRSVDMFDEPLKLKAPDKQEDDIIDIEPESEE